jgi:hypothetical protein
MCDEPEFFEGVDNFLSEDLKDELWEIVPDICISPRRHHEQATFYLRDDLGVSYPA